MFDLLFKLFPLTAVLLQFATWSASKVDSVAFNVNLVPSASFAIFIKLLWGRGCLIVEASLTLNLAYYFSFSNAMKPRI